MAQNVSIPYSHKSTQSYAMMRAFIRDFIDELQKTYVARGSKATEMWKIPALQMKYLWQGPEDTKEYLDKEIAATRKIERTSERVRFVMLELSAAAIQMLENGKAYENIVASDEMRNMFSSFKQELRPVELFDLLSKRYAVNKEDKKTLMFFLDGLKYKRSDSKYSKEYCIDTTVFDDNAISILKKTVGIIIKFFKKDPRPLRLETEVRSFMKSEKKWTDEECEQIEAYLKADTAEYEWLGLDNLGRHLVALNWESLDAVDSRLVRILFEYGKSNVSDPYMNHDELIQEYNRRALKFGIDPIPAGQSIPKHPHIKALGAGRYCYKGDTAPANPINLRAEIKKFVGANNGIVIVDNALAFAQNLNPNYSLNTVRRYLAEANCLFDTWNKTKYAVHNDPESLKKYFQMTGEWITPQPSPARPKPISPKTLALRNEAVKLLLQAPGNTMRKKDLVTALTPYYSGKSLATTLSSYLKDDLFIPVGKGKGSSYSLNMELYKSKNGQ